jgi:hypothetical protein
MNAMRLIYSSLMAGAGVLSLAAQPRSFPLDSTDGLKLNQVGAEAVGFKGRKAIRVTEPAGAPGQREDRLAILAGTEFEDGTFEVELAGQPGGGATEGARGFVGIAFRIAPDLSKYECFYLRPTNGRADDQVRRNHSAQYVSFPDFPWPRLRKEFPEKYESYVDLVPGEWTKVRIEVSGLKARLYVHGGQQPTLVVSDLKLGTAKGAIGLWIGPGTLAHFSNLRLGK